MDKTIISPSILSADFANLEKEIKKLEECGADWIHIDVMDGHFVPNLTIGAPVVKSIRRITTLPLDVHLMIENPQKYIKDFISAGADIITIHYEAAKEKISEIIDEIKSHNIKAGLSIKPKTSFREILPYVNKIDLILIMTVEPGFGGQKFMEECALKIKEIREETDYDAIIEVDGGINNQTGKYCIDLGADALVAGNYIYKSVDMKEAIASLRG